MLGSVRVKEDWHWEPELEEGKELVLDSIKVREDKHWDSIGGREGISIALIREGEVMCECNDTVDPGFSIGSVRG